MGDGSIYTERARLIAHLAAIYPAIMTHDADQAAPGWPVIYLELPTGQVSWHLHPDDLVLFGHVPAGTVAWDGHTTDDKYRRLEAHTRFLTTT